MKVFRCLHCLIMSMQGPEEIRLGTGHLHNSCLSEPQVIRVQEHNRKIKKKINYMFIFTVLCLCSNFITAIQVEYVLNKPLINTTLSFLMCHVSKCILNVNECV